ncbi:MAG TPA: glycosyltransferase, partial [Candidatus Nanopelagicales bacterium]|nr:glycosyltransferase [Candidatus Nanopelagicales bacterium]
MRALHLLTLGLLAWTHVGWGLFVRAVRRLGLGRVTDDRESRSVVDAARAGGATTAAETERPASPSDVGRPASAGRVDHRPTVSVVIAAYAEEDAIAQTVAGLAAQTWPRDRLQIVVACDGSTDRTAERARAAGADLVLELPRGGKHHAQAGGVARATGEILAFSDANTSWEPTALEELVAAFEDPQVGYACGRVSFVAPDVATGVEAGAAPNQEGAYWRMEMALRRRESDWWSVTAGNGAIYALRAALWSQL